MTTATNNVARIAAVVGGAALVLSVFAPFAGAQTTTTTTSTTTTSSATFTRNLTIGSHGTDVTALQTWLIAKGFSIPAGATGYFGSQTKAALGAYQAANGISPAVGYFGPITRAAVAAGGSVAGLPAGCTSTAGFSTTTGASCSTSTTLPAGCTSTAGFSPTTGVSCSTGTTTTTTGPLSGGEGRIDNFKILGATSISMNAADSDTAYGFEFKAGGSDLAVNRVYFDVYHSAGTGSTRPWNIFSKAVLMNGSRTVATVDGSNMDNWSQDGTVGGVQQYRVSFDGLNDVIKMDNTADYYLMLYTQNSISTSNAGTGSVFSVSLAAQGLRAVDAKGIQQYTTSATSYNTVAISGSSTGSLTISTASDNPQTTTVNGNSSSVTSDVALASFTLQAKDSDVTIYSLPMQLATTSATASVITRTVKLYQGSTLIDTESYSSGQSATSTFKNLNVKIPAGTTSSFSIKTDINAIDGTTLPEGASLAVTVPSYGWDVSNAAGDQITPTGSVSGNVITFRSIGLALDSSPTSATATKSVPGTGTQETGTFTFTFNVTAFGQDIYVSSTTNGFTPVAVYDSAGVATTTVAYSITSTADRSALSNYVVHSGQSKQFSISYTKLGQSGYAYAKLSTLKFGSTDAAPLASSATFSTNYQTPQIYLAD